MWVYLLLFLAFLVFLSFVATDLPKRMGKMGVWVGKGMRFGLWGALMFLGHRFLGISPLSLAIFLRGLQGKSSAAPPPPPPSSSQMTPKEALEVLGLKGTPNKADVLRAHRTLIARLHPDQGGNDYLAGRVNQARDVLLQTLACEKGG